jgi:gliding motility-associated-like protein
LNNRIFLSFITTLLLSTISIQAQLGFCNGSKGDPIFFENFGSGTNFGPQLPVGVTSYTYFSGTPDDGQYTLYYLLNPNPTWHNSPDHTPDNTSDGTLGKALIVNAGFTAGEFYSRTVSGLCVNTTFEFTAWLMNVFNAGSGVCPGNGIPTDVTFEIWDESETVLLKTGSTGPMPGTFSPQWTQYGLVFTTLPNQTSVVLKMKNNGIGGCGNDLAIDDIMFRSCGDLIEVDSPSASGTFYKLCDDALPFSLPLEVTIGGTAPHVFQWQQSSDNLTWTDIPGESFSTYNAAAVAPIRHYRVKVAEDAINLANAYCYTVSNVFTIEVAPKPTAPTSSGNIEICSGTAIPALTVSVPAGQSVDWFNAANGGNVILSNSLTFTPSEAGIYYAEAFLQNGDCRSDNRTAMSVIVNPSPATTNQELVLCADRTLSLDAGIPNAQYIWQPAGQTSQIITIDEPGNYSVLITNSFGCSAVRTIAVTENPTPVITDVETKNNSVTIITAQEGDYSYSLDGINYQLSNQFTSVAGGIYTAYVTENNTCGDDEMEFLLVVFPTYFTPNGDGYNDYFSVPDLSMVSDAQISIFDRYGKLVAFLTNTNSLWDGKLDNKNLPATDYWYRALINGKIYKGHFSIKR